MQNFRDGPRVSIWPDIIRVVRMIAALIVMITGLILSLWCAVDKEWSEATFWLVLMWWSESDFKGLRDNGSAE